MSEEKSISVQQFYDFITSKMTAEQALMKLLQGPVMTYEKLKFDEGEEVHPLIIMSFAAMEMGWDFLIEKNQPDVRGVVTGTAEYMEQWMNK